MWESEEPVCLETLSSGHSASGRLALWRQSERDKVELGPWRQAEETQNLDKRPIYVFVGESQLSCTLS